MKRYLLIFALAVLAALSCSREELTVSREGQGEVTISFRTSGVYARSTVPGDGNVADGGGVYIDQNDGTPDLVILVADPSGTIVKTYPGSGSALQDGAEATEMSVTISGLDPGIHTVYAFANTEGLWNMSSGGSSVTDLTTLTLASQVEALQFSPLSADTCPALMSGRLPMSAKGTFEIGTTGNGELSLQLLRCVAKITMEFINNTENELTLDDFSYALRNLCPDRGFVVPHALPDLPSGITYGDIEEIVGDGVVLDASGDDVSHKDEFLVFPGVAVPRSRDYTLDVAFRANGAASVKNFVDLPIHDDRAVNVVSLERNQHLHIRTKISKGLTVSFNFEVEPWEQKTEQILFE